MRESCLDCVIKHLCQCLVLEMEYRQGYEDHYFWILGHLAEAESESLARCPSLASTIRETRLNLIRNKDWEPDFMVLIKEVASVKGND